MDDETAKYLWGLREVNKSLITGLESAILVMDKWDELTAEKRPRRKGKREREEKERMEREKAEKEKKSNE